MDRQAVDADGVLFHHGNSASLELRFEQGKRTIEQLMDRLRPSSTILSKTIDGLASRANASRWLNPTSMVKITRPSAFAFWII